MTERKRCSGQRSIYLQKSPGDANMTTDDLWEIIQENRTYLKELLGRMQAYNGYINGSNAYMFKQHQELESLISQKGQM